MDMPSNIGSLRCVRLVAIAIGIVVMGPARSQETGPPPHVQEFMLRLERAVDTAGRDVDTEAYHFVLLLNTVRTAGAGAHWARDVASHLLHDYLTVGDRVSILPYQLTVRPEAVWDQVFDRALAEDLYKKIPLEPMLPVQGHDTEGAVLEAVQRLEAPSSAIYITLSDSEASQRPPQHRWNEAKQEKWRGLFSSGTLREADKNRISGIALDAKRQPHPATLYYRIYLAGNLEPLRSGITRPAPDPVQPPRIEKPLPPPLPPPPPPPPATNIWLIVLRLLMGVVAIAAVLFGAIWLLQPRQITVRYGDGEYHGSVTVRSQLRIGGKDCKGIELPGLDDGTKLMVLSADALGRVVARGLAPYSIISPKEPVMLGRSPRRLTVKRMDDTLDLEVWRS